MCDQIFFVTPVRGSGSVPTIFAKYSEGCIGFMNALFFLTNHLADGVARLGASRAMASPCICLTVCCTTIQLLRELQPTGATMHCDTCHYFLGRKFGQMKTSQTKHDANSKNISAATRTERICS
jgi:hypothetical protein